MNYNLKHNYEYWKPIKTYKNGTLIDYSDTYFVSNLGRIKSKDREVEDGRCCRFVQGQIMNQFENNGYLMVTLRKDGTKHNFKVHRLVAEQFLPNPDNLPCINHKDFDRKNNTIVLNDDGTPNEELSNIEWCSYSYNNENRRPFCRQRNIRYWKGRDN